MHPRRRPLGGVLGILLLVAPALSQVKNDFSFYPTSAQSCLNRASDSSRCSGATVPEMNSCLCSNGGNFVTNSAACIGRQAQSDLQKVFDLLQTACSDSRTPLTVSEDEFMSAARSGSQTSTTAATTTAARTSTRSSTDTTQTATNTNSPGGKQEGEPGLSTGTKIAAGVGAGLGVIALGAALLFIWRAKRSRKAHIEAQPMLGGLGDAGAGAAGSTTYQGSQDWKAENKPPTWRPVSSITSTGSPGHWHTPSPQTWDPTQQGWGHHPNAPYNPQGYGQYGFQPPEQPAVYELASMPASGPPPPANNAVEMPADSAHPVAHHYPTQSAPPVAHHYQTQYGGYGR